MSIEKKLFGSLADGTEIYAYTLVNANGMSAKILSYGGAIAELRVPDRNGCFTDVVGGYDCLESYVGGNGYQGALIGRFGNRINKGKFTLDGVEFTLRASKEAPTAALHGIYSEAVSTENFVTTGGLSVTATNLGDEYSVCEWEHEGVYYSLSRDGVEDISTVVEMIMGIVD